MKKAEYKAPNVPTAHGAQLEKAKSYTPEQKEKLSDINRKLGKWKRKTLTESEIKNLDSKEAEE